MGNFRNLKAWKASQELAVLTYQATDCFPAAERFGLTAQMRRAAVSIMSNIAEGTGHGTDAQFANFLRIARGSLHELESQGLLAIELALCPETALEQLLTGVQRTARLLHGLMRSLETGPSHPSHFTTET